MCGILGWRSAEEKPDKALLKKMAAAIEHRGPDSDGFFVSEGIGLGFRRLAIIDLSRKGNQPMSSASGRSTIVFNGEIYNFQELREGLGQYPFRSGTDTEVILALYEKQGDRCVEMLRGMFAFAIWDAHRKRLFLARDRLGKKPLHYHYDPRDGTLLFASELKALLQHPKLAQRTVDDEALRLYVQFGYVPAPRTIWNEVRKLPPGHTLTLEGDGTLHIRQYWDVDFNAKTSLSMADAQRRVRELLEESVRLRMISDVPLGAFLSGGIDSSAVVACMAKASDQPVKTFSVGFDEGKYDELAFARAVAEKYSTDHREIVLRPDFLRDLPRIMRCYDEPFADGSAIPTHYISRETRKHVTVALNGDGGDESFAGYARYVQGMRARYVRLPPLPRGQVPRTGTARIAELLAMGSRDRYYSLHKAFEQRHLFRDVRPELVYPFDLHYRHPKLLLDKWLYTDIKTYLPDDLLVKVDVATMANSLEGRSPLLDHKLVEFAASLPPQWKLQGQQTKIIFRRAVADLLPDAVRKKPKQGFAVPIPEWMRGELGSYAEQELLSESEVLGRLDKGRIRRLLELHRRGKPYGYRLWNLLMLREWEKHHL